jgi:amylosucrase
MDWSVAERRHDPHAVEGRLWGGLKRLMEARRRTHAVHAQGRIEPFWTGNDHVFGLLREHAGERVMLLGNFTADQQAIRLEVVHERGHAVTPEAGVPDGRPLREHGDFLVLEPYQYAWLHGEVPA